MRSQQRHCRKPVRSPIRRISSKRLYHARAKRGTLSDTDPASFTLLSVRVTVFAIGVPPMISRSFWFSKFILVFPLLTLWYGDGVCAEPKVQILSPKDG